MNNRKRENSTLSFDKNLDRGSVEETFYPWSLTFERWKKKISFKADACRDA